MSKDPYPRTRLQALGSAVFYNNYAGTIDIEERMAFATDYQLQHAFMEIGMRMIALERCTQSHKVRSSLKWLRWWNILICDEMQRRREFTFSLG